MTEIHIDSVKEPFATDRVLTGQALRLLSRAQFVGCLPDTNVTSLGAETLRLVGKCMAQAGLPTVRWSLLLEQGDHLTGPLWREALAAMNEQIEMSPLPNGEWGPAVDSLGEDLLAALLRISVSSVRRYRATTRSTPQAIAERLHFVALLLADLAGSYNDYGRRRWFTRRREALGGRRPVDLLGADFDPDGADALTLRDLAASLIGAGAA